MDYLEQHEPQNSLTFWARVKHDVGYRAKLLKMTRICCLFCMIGWVLALDGPTLPEIRLIIREDLDKSSWLFTVSFIGHFLGSAALGLLYKIKRKSVLFVTITLCLALSEAAFPWCRYFYLMLTVKCLVGFFSGIINAGCNAEVASMWTTNTGFYMQILHFCLSLGAMISPLAAQPFLASEHCLQLRADLNKTTWNSNEDRLSNIRQNVSDMIFLGRNSSSSYVCSDLSSETNVMYVYVLTAALLALTSIPFLVDICTSKTISSQRIDLEKAPGTGKFQALSIIMKVVILLSISLLFLLYSGVEMSFAGFLSTFTISYLTWSKRTGALATSVNWICFGITRLAAIYFVRHIRTVTILCLFPILLIISHTCLLISSLVNIEALVLVSIGMVGLSMSTIFPAVFTWTSESITPVSGNISSLFYASASVGLIVFPVIFGYTMDRLSPLWFVYLSIGESILWLVIFLAAVLLCRRVLTVSVVKIEPPEEELLGTANNTQSRRAIVKSKYFIIKKSSCEHQLTHNQE